MEKRDSILIPNISTDCVIFGFDFNKLNVLLIERKSSTDNKSEYALPGDLVYENENLNEAAERVLYELTGLRNIYLEQLAVFGNPERLKREEDVKWLQEMRSQPDVRVITIAYYSLVNMKDYVPQASSFAKKAEWIPLKKVPKMAYDHSEILETAIIKLREKIKIKPIGFNLLPEKFTISQLHKLYQAVLDKKLDKRNFRRKIFRIGLLTDLNEKQKDVPHKPSQYYKFNEENYSKLSKSGYDDFSF